MKRKVNKCVSVNVEKRSASADCIQKFFVLRFELLGS